MTTDARSLKARIAEQNPNLINAVMQTITYCTLALMLITDEATQHDAGAALESLVDALDPAGELAQDKAFKDDERPATDDARHLYERLDAYAPPPVSKVFRECILSMTIQSMGLSGQTYRDFRDVLDRFTYEDDHGLGLAVLKDQATDAELAALIDKEAS